ncbi:MAG: hypothetical protein KA436_03385 [Oligoflexales bacterium]|nr:hypothetical protein [Oligoflexales bacterium]
MSSSSRFQKLPIFEGNGKLFIFLSVIFAQILCSAQAYCEAKTFVLSLPLVTAGREGSLRGEYNLAQKGSLALEWAEWGSVDKRQELSGGDLKSPAKDGLWTDGRDLGLMYSRFHNPQNMSGFYWGVGLGYRRMQADWRKTNAFNSSFESSLANADINENHLEITGPTAFSRLGYRFVGEDLGFMIGSYAGLKHFQSQITESKSEDIGNDSLLLSEAARDSLQRRLMSSVKLGLEIGWAF